jgi:hypothetical protein
VLRTASSSQSAIKDNNHNIQKLQIVVIVFPGEKELEFAC